MTRTTTPLNRSEDAKHVPEPHDPMPEDDGLWDFGGHMIFPEAA